MKLRAKTEFEKALAKGQKGEEIVALALRQRGWLTINNAAIEENNKGPRMYGMHRAVILPDYWAVKEGKMVAVEVKWKRKKIRYGIANEYRHGWDKRLNDHYLRCQEESGLRVIMAVIEDDVGELLLRPLDELMQHVRHHEGDIEAFGEEMVFFPRDEFRLYAQIKDPGDILPSAYNR